MTCCSINSQCINEQGNYRCVCKNGWAGKFCHISPTVWASNYKIPVNNLILPVFNLKNQTIRYIVNQSTKIIVVSYKCFFEKI